MTDEEKPDKNLRASKFWLDKLGSAQKIFQKWQDTCTNIDKRYAALKQMAEAVGDREFQIFWANMEVLKPTIYSRAPQPVVTPRFSSNKKEVVRKAAELLERTISVDIESDDLHETLKLVRDDLALSARGVPWVLDDGRCIHVDRQDFVHEPARKWSEVGWVARRAYVGRKEGTERFGKAFDKVKIEVPKDDEKNERGTEKKASIWEIWSRNDNIVVWVSEGSDTVLDAEEPLINVKGFFPCPRPAYGTLERRTLIPVPDLIYYRDQVDEVNELTARISSLSESLRLKGFYASGASELGDAIESALKVTDNNAVLIPVSNFAALGGASIKDSIIWMPVREVAEVITSLVALRRQLIEDIYEITGLSDIMRGSTQASETATAQNLKAQYGSVRVRERQGEMVRVARDIIRLKAEVYAEQYPAAELARMTDMELPTGAQAQQMAAQAQAQGQQADMSKIVTIDQVDAFLKEERIRPFLLEVESDSTIAPNEAEEKASRIEFIGAMGQFINQAGAMVAQQPETAPFAAEMMKFVAGGFRAGRELGGVIDDFAEQIKAKAALAQQGPDPQQKAAEVEARARQAEMQIKAQEASTKQFDAETKRMEAQARSAQIEAESRERQSAALGEIAGNTPILADAIAEALAAAKSNDQQAAQVLLETAEAIMASNQQVLAAVTAPKEIVRDTEGRPVGVRIAETVGHGIH